MSKKTFISLCVIGVILIFIGSFYDYQISVSFFNITNKLAVFLAGYGETPAVIVSWLGAMILLPIFIRKNDKKGIRNVILLLIIPLYIFYETYVYYVDYLVVGILLQIIICYIISRLIYKKIRACDEKKLIRFGYLCMILPVAQILFVSILKLIWARARYRSIFLNQGLVFEQWYTIDWADRIYYMRNKIFGLNEFCSFPSGHTSNSECLIVLLSLPYLKKSFNNYKWVLYIIIFGFTALVGYSRIVMGAHFLTDVSMGYLITLCFNYYLVKKTKIE